MSDGKDSGIRGKIIRGVGGFYYVYSEGKGLYACRARGIFRKLKIKPLPGDDVIFDITDTKDMEGSITSILPRKNTVIRPAAVNVDQAMIIFAVSSPQPNFNLLDRFLLLMRRQDIPTLICFNKTDLAEPEETQRICRIYENCGCRVLTASVKTGQGLDEVRKVLDAKTTIVAGPSGVGKSSMTNAVYPEANMETGRISEKIQRGRHTTRHTELFALGGDTYLMDTPGFSTIWLDGIEKEDLKYYYPEFETYRGRCRFNGCNHLSEPDCAVKQAVKDGLIARERWENYRLFFEEIAQKRQY